jgi:hypothetical protein
MIDRIFHHAEVSTLKGSRNRRKHFLTHPLPYKRPQNTAE